MTDARKELRSLKTIRTFMKVGACSETLINCLNRAFGEPMAPEEHASMPLAGGIMRQGYQCGMLWGASLAAGAEAHRQFGPGPKAEAMSILASQRLVERFSRRTKTINCLEITDTDWNNSWETTKYMLRGGPVYCFRMAARYAREAHEEITACFADPAAEIPVAPVSCTSLFVRKMGLSERHATMTSGFAGGIGLCGGACGALGAAVWLLAMVFLKDDPQANMWKSKEFQAKLDALIETYLKSSDFEFECEKVVGRKFDGVEDHARHTCEGGCATILEALAAYLKANGYPVEMDEAKA